MNVVCAGIYMRDDLYDKDFHFKTFISPQQRCHISTPPANNFRFEVSRLKL